jgi:hypothetical protein
MKTIFQIVLISCTFLLSCKEHEVNIAVPSKQEKAEVATIGKKAAGILIETLQKELKEAITRDGVVEAISVCNKRALYLTDSLAKNLNRVSEIKRTSLNYRNPKNAPDKYEMAALNLYINGQQDKKEIYIQKILSESGAHFRYYQPLRMKPVCSRCHGHKNNLSAELQKRLVQLYPNDKATGFSGGDFRGLIRVSIQQ